MNHHVGPVEAAQLEATSGLAQAVARVARGDLARPLEVDARDAFLARNAQAECQTSAHRMIGCGECQAASDLGKTRVECLFDFTLAQLLFGPVAFEIEVARRAEV